MGTLGVGIFAVSPTYGFVSGKMIASRSAVFSIDFPSPVLYCDGWTQRFLGMR